MFRNAKDLKTYRLQARDGDVGHLKDLYFDDQHWVIRYLVVDTGGLLRSHKVLLAPEAVHEAVWDDKILHVDLTKEQVNGSPGWDAAKPVSRQYETQLRQFYGWPPYWGAFYGEATGGVAAVPVPALVSQESPKGDPHLYSTSAVSGYAISASDGEIGHVADFLVDDTAWTVRYLMIDTKNWLPGRHVLVSPSWIVQIGWSSARIAVDLTRDAIKNSPEYDPKRPIGVEYSAALHEYYRKPERSEVPAGRR